MKRMFVAHYPAVATLVEHSHNASLRAAEARESLQRLVSMEAATARFPRDAGWYPWSVAEAALVQLDAILAHDNLRLNSPSGGTSLAWPSLVIWEIQTPDGAAQAEAEERLRAWVEEIADSAEAKLIHRVAAEVDKARSAARAALEPIRHDAPIRRARRCEICFPP